MKTTAPFLPLVLLAVWLMPAVPAHAEGLREKVDALVIGKMEFEESDIETIVEFLRVETKRLDPDKEGVNFFLKLDPNPNARSRKSRLTLNLSNVPLYEVIRYVCMAANLNFKIEESAVVIGDSTVAIEPMETRTYIMRPGVIDSQRTRKRKHMDGLIEDDDDDNGGRNNR